MTDFDGTMTEIDFYKLVRERLVPPETPDFWVEYRAGTMTHFDALRSFFEAAEGGEPALIKITQEMKLESQLSSHLAALRESGWSVSIVSAGCAWYIRRMLAEANVTIDVHASPGKIVEGRLVMELPLDSAFCSTETGIDKAAVVRSFLDRGATVAFAGDGYPDLAPALLVDPSVRFARGDLAIALQERNEPFLPFTRWAEIVEMLTATPSD